MVLRSLAAGVLALALASGVGVAVAHPDQSPAASSATTADADEVKAVLRAYKSALERLDLAGVERLFATGNVVIESGKVEGSYADYLAHHIGPELAEFKSFSFSNYAVDVQVHGDVASAVETYNYRIELKSGGAPIERRGAATTFLRKIDGRWLIVLTHNSSRKPA